MEIIMILLIVVYVYLCYVLSVFFTIIDVPKEGFIAKESFNPREQMSNEEFTRNFMEQLEFNGERNDQSKN